MHIDDENQIEELKTVSIEEEDLLFSTESFSVFAIVSPSVHYTQEGTGWNGSVATSFAWGTGSASDPYLITSGEEFAYLRARVNAGDPFIGRHFKLANNINLNNNVWIPIGTAYTNFAGVFDGQGYTISNAIINANGTNSQMFGYGIFGSISGSAQDNAAVRNVVFDNIQINITFPSSELNYDFGYKIGIVAGAMYRYTRIENVIVKNSRISNNSWTTVAAGSRPSVFVGGIVGEAAYSSVDSLTQVTDGKYVINNCYSDVDINIDLYSNEIEGACRLLIGGIIGRISWHTAWPTSCLYTGTIGGSSSTMMMGPIFGGETSRNYDLVDNFTYMAMIWEGTGDLTMTSYYTDYTVKGTSFNSTITTGDTPDDLQYRLNANPEWYGHVAGVNKGIYTTELDTTILDMFNTNAENSNYAKWTYSNGTFNLKPGLELAVTETSQDLYKFTITPTSSEQNPNYTYRWYINNVLDNTRTTNSSDFEPSFVTARRIQVLVSDGKNVSLAQFSLDRLTLGVTITENNGTLIPQFTGTGVPLVSFNDYDINWYEIDVVEGRLPNAISANKNLSGIQLYKEYQLELTNGYEGVETLIATYLYGQRNIVYVNNVGYTINGTSYVGNNNNSGATPENAVSTMERAYQLIPASGNWENNIIVVMGDYNATDYLDVRGGNAASYNDAASRFDRNALVIGKYKGTNYNAYMNFSCMDNAYNGKYLFGDTRFEYITFNGNRGSTFLYLQGNDIILGSGIVMTNYEDIDSSDFGQVKGLRSPKFSMFCGFHNYNYTSIPADSKECNVIIRSRNLWKSFVRMS